MFGGSQAGRRNNRAEIITHPLWESDPPRMGPLLTRADTEAHDAGCSQVRFKSIFEVLRRPF